MTKRYDYATQKWVEEDAFGPTNVFGDPRPTEPVDLPKWPGGPATDASPSASNERKEITVTEQNKEVNIEDPTMLDRIFKALAGKVVEASDLAKRVGELEQRIDSLRADLTRVQSDLDTERKLHQDTATDLRDTRNRLDHEQRAVHDLVVERDMERDAKGQAQASLAQTQKDQAFWMSEAESYSKQLVEANHSADVCREQREQMAKQVAALREAFGALRVIG